LCKSDRPAVVPVGVGPYNVGLVARRERPALEDLAALATGLRDLQCQSMEDHGSWYLENSRVRGAGRLHQARNDLRLWAALSEAQRRSAASPPGLLVRDLAEAQRRAYLAALGTEQSAEYDPLPRRHSSEPPPSS
jgi:hypothetical protein